MTALSPSLFTSLVGESFTSLASLPGWFGASNSRFAALPLGLVPAGGSVYVVALPEGEIFGQIQNPELWQAITPAYASHLEAYRARSRFRASPVTEKILAFGIELEI